MTDQTLAGLSSLPTPLTRFIGREREVASIVSLLRRPGVRLVTLTGPGGVGKTRLVIRVAEEVAAEFSDGVWFVPLEPIRDAGLVPSAMAERFGLRENSSQRPEEQIRAFLRARHALVILDNVEHLLAAGPLVADLLASSPNLSVVATSREVLRLSGEHVHAVPPMALPDADNRPGFDEMAAAEAVRLFAERAAAAHTDFALSPDNAAAVTEICRRLDGLPLAIELAAVRVAVFTPVALLERLERCLSLLTGGPRDAPDRHRAMRAAIEWSHDLLSAEERALFRRLAVFVGGFTLEAAEATAPVPGDPDVDVVDGITSLVGKSLIRPVRSIAEQRFSMLETIREFALDRLVASGEEVVIRSAHAAWFLWFAERTELGLDGPEPEVLSSQVETEMGNIRAALAWAIDCQDADTALRLAAALGPIWLRHGPYGESRAWLEQALALGDGPVGARVAAEVTLAQLAFLQGDLVRAAALGEQALARARAAGDRPRAARALLAIGQAVARQGDLGRSAQCHDEALALFRALGDARGIAQTLDHLGVVALLSGEFERFASLAEETLALWRETGDRAQIIMALDRLSLVARLRGERERQATLVREVVALSWELGDRWVVASTLWTVASIAGERGKFAISARFFGAEEALREATGFVLDLAFLSDYDRVVSDVRAALGEAAFASAWAGGWALHPAQTVAEALALMDCLMAEPDTAATTGASVAGGAEWGLTRREAEVLRLLAEGHADKEIATALNISRHTAGHHVASILAKLGVESRAAAVAQAVRHGLA
ncbi:MAG: AAA family ATPase [Chloroflexi bacterium]|nr:AAA family ATPase [Chloroflexota bacterium]